jgi:hypothetical protein
MLLYYSISKQTTISDFVSLIVSQFGRQFVVVDNGMRADKTF